MEHVIRILLMFQNFVFHVMNVIYTIMYRKKPPGISPTKNPLLKLNVVTLAKKIREGDVSCQAVIEAYVERIKEVNPTINSVVEDRFEAAINDAKTWDEKLRSGEVTVSELEKEKPLYGLPFTVKESCGCKGMSNTGCSLVRKNVKATEDIAVVDAYKKAGAIPLCVTNTPELCIGYDTYNFVKGKTHNPYDLRRSVGGSSGGEAALMGSGASLIGVGSDLAGSLRIPGLFNGVYAHKPSAGIISCKGHYPFTDSPDFEKFLTIGPFARCAEDLHLLYKVIILNCGKDLKLDEPVDVKKLKVFYVESMGRAMGFPSTSSDISDCIRRGANYLGDIGATVKEWPFDMTKSIDICMILYTGMKKKPPLVLDPHDLEKEKNVTLEILKSIFGLSNYTTSLLCLRMMQKINCCIPSSKHHYYETLVAEIAEEYTKLLGDDGVLIYPSYITAAPLFGLPNSQFASTVYDAFWNILGFPATQVPIGLNKEKLPIGFQVIAALNQDRLCLAVAKELEKKFGGWIPPYADKLHSNA